MKIFETTTLPISAWAEEDRPREKLIKLGIGALTNAELLAILLGSGNSNESAVGLSRRILSDMDDDLHKLGRMNISELQRFNGIGEAKAVSIRAAMELGKRRASQAANKRRKIASSRDVFEIFHPKLADLDHEEFWMLCLDRANGVRKEHLISKGGVTGTVADPKVIFRAALEQSACAIILIHNHPSGNLQPSEADKHLTKKLIQGGELVEIRVLDHLIIGDTGYFSFADSGLIE
ncbi:MAG: DNA repair protein RadC [Flavobacteriales bacterium]|nr:DNA repair protein RadC [Flavobacteriales bacterium]